MGLTSSLQIGRTGLQASQSALQVAGNNLANIATEGYHRQKVELAPTPYRNLGQGKFIGTGVQITNIVRQVDEALEARLRGSISDQSASAQTSELLQQIESIQNELTDVDISTRLNEFFNAWNDLAGNPQDLSLRTLVTEQANTLSVFINDVRSEYGRLVKQVDDQTRNVVSTANDILDRIEQLNTSIAAAEGGQGPGAGGLRDQRGILLSDLAGLIDISTVESNTGVIDIFVGSQPIMINGTSRGIELETFAEDGELQTEVRVAADKAPLEVTTGEIGALVEFRQVQIEDAIDALDTLANTLAFEVNKIHSSSQGLNLLASTTGTTLVGDTSLALNDSTLDLEFTPEHGSLQFHVTQLSTGQRNTSVINIDLDGIDPTNDTSLASFAADLNAVANVSASITPDGRLQIDSDSGDFRFSFSEDSSGVLAVLGINTFFKGGDAFDLSVNTDLVGDPRMIAVGQGHLPGDNRAALAIASLQDTGIESLQGLSVSAFWDRHVEDFAVRTAQAQDKTLADTIVRDNLSEQQQAISGVNADEETISLIQHQRAFQASARFISVVDELLNTLINLI